MELESVGMDNSGGRKVSVAGRGHSGVRSDKKRPHEPRFRSGEELCVAGREALGRYLEWLELDGESLAFGLWEGLSDG